MNTAPMRKLFSAPIVKNGSIGMTMPGMRTPLFASTAMRLITTAVTAVGASSTRRMPALAAMMRTSTARFATPVTTGEDAAIRSRTISISRNPYSTEKIADILA